MARKSRQSFLKRQREARRSEKAALKRQKRMERRKGIGPEIEGEGVEGEGVEGAGVEGAIIEGQGIEQQPENLNEFPARIPDEGFPTPEPASDKTPVDTES